MDMPSADELELESKKGGKGFYANKWEKQNT